MQPFSALPRDFNKTLAEKLIAAIALEKALQRLTYVAKTVVTEDGIANLQH